MKCIALLVLFVTACAGNTKRELYYTFRADSRMRDLVAPAEAAARTDGYTIAEEDLTDENGLAFVAVKHDKPDAMLVQIGMPEHVKRYWVRCTSECMTTVMVTPLAQVNAQQFAVIRNMSNADEDQARELLAAIAQTTMTRRDALVP
jgi:hypothetical protein